MAHDLSIPRMLRIVLVLAAGGALIAWGINGARNAAGFLCGAALAWLTVRSWGQLAQAVAGDGKPAMGSATFLALRYFAVAAALYVTIKILGSSPVATILGLLVSFVSVLLELLYGAVVARNGRPQK